MDAIAAYDAGATGDGVIVAILDSGIKTDSPEFSGRISSASRDIAGSPSRGIVDTTGHGTAVAGIVGAARNDSGTMGVAFDSTLLVKIGRAHVRTPVTNAHLVCRLLLEKKKIHLT